VQKSAQVKIVATLPHLKGVKTHKIAQIAPYSF